MDKMIPKEKMSKARQKELNLKARADWGEIRPVSRIIPDKKKYDRKRDKRNGMVRDFET